jgi:hypothetical protein
MFCTVLTIKKESRNIMAYRFITFRAFFWTWAVVIPLALFVFLGGHPYQKEYTCHYSVKLKKNKLNP